jgi:hypothetical protein
MTLRKISLSFLTASLLGLSSLVMAQYDYPADPVAAGAITSERGQIYSAIVTKIDAKNRVVTFKNKDRELDIVAGPEVKNFAQIKVGDRLDVQYALAVAIELVKTKNNDVRGREVTSDTQTVKAVDKPGRVKTNIVKTTASVVAIDQKKQIVSLKGPKDNVVDVKVENPTLLKGITVKDSVFVTYAEAVATVMSAPKK